MPDVDIDDILDMPILDQDSDTHDGADFVEDMSDILDDDEIKDIVEEDDKNINEIRDMEDIECELTDVDIDIKDSDQEDDNESTFKNLEDSAKLREKSSKVLAANINPNKSVAKYVGDPTENDKLLSSIRSRSSNSTVLNNVMEEIAEEVAYLKAWRNENWDGEKDISDATSKRILALRKIVETLIDREKLKQEKNLGKIDFYSENFQNVLKHFLEVIQETFTKVNIPRQYSDIFFSQLAKDFDGFEKKAEKIYYGKK